MKEYDSMHLRCTLNSYVFSKDWMRRMVEPNDIARAVLFLASDMANYITGSQIAEAGARF